MWEELNAFERVLKACCRVGGVEHRGFVLIADITGYTSYLSLSELEHAQGTLSDLLELLVERTRPPLVVAQLEGDAVMSYAFEDGFVSTQTFLEKLEETYVEFRRAIDLMVLNNTCGCNACANVSALDLKFFVHFGAFVIQPVGDIRQVIGTDINLVHRLLKNSVTADTGIGAYVLFTEAAVAALGLDTTAEGMVDHREVVSDFGEISVSIKDMHPVYEASRGVQRAFYDPDEILMTLETDIPMPLEHVWNYVNQSPFRNLIIGSDRYEVHDRKAGRVVEGSTYQCYHGTMIVSQLVLEWMPFDRVVLQQLIPLPGKRPTHTIIDLRFTSIEEGTRLSQTATQPTGPPLQRGLAKMMMRLRRSRTQTDMDEFGDRILDDFAGHLASRATPVRVPSSYIEVAEINSVAGSQTDLDT